MAKSRTLLTPTLSAQIAEYLKQGIRLRTAAHLAGVSYKSVRRWIERGKTEERGIYKDFLESVREAEADLENRLVGKWIDALENEPDGWKGISNFLERRFPRDWSAKQMLEVNQHLEYEGSVEVKIDDDPDRLAGVLNVLTAVGAIPPIREEDATSENFIP